MQVCVMGTGHVGLVTCASLAAVGHHVVGVDTDDRKIDRLRKGTLPFYEPGLQEMVDDGVREGRLSFRSVDGAPVPDAEIVFLCVGTPARASGAANLLALETAARQAIADQTGRTVLAEKSTVPAGTAERIRQTVRRDRPDLASDIEVVSNPEFLREGNAVHDSMLPSRILIGSESEWALERMRRLYEPFTEAGAPLIETDIATAELSKHACNAFLALKISYINAIARLCDLAGADIVAVAQVMGTDERIGRSFLDAGLGWGGYCFPKDIQAFKHLSNTLGYDFGLLEEAARINAEAVEAVVDNVRHAVWNLEDKRIALWGLAFKPGTDDVRFSPALELARRLIEEKATVVGYDPEASDNARREMSELTLVGDPYEAVRDADCVVVCTGWKEFETIDLAKVKELLKYPVVVDGRNVFDPEKMRTKGFTYYPTGRPMVEGNV